MQLFASGATEDLSGIRRCDTSGGEKLHPITERFLPSSELFEGLNRMFRAATGQYSAIPKIDKPRNGIHRFGDRIKDAMDDQFEPGQVCTLICDRFEKRPVKIVSRHTGSYRHPRASDFDRLLDLLEHLSKLRIIKQKIPWSTTDQSNDRHICRSADVNRFSEQFDCRSHSANVQSLTKLDSVGSCLRCNAHPVQALYANLKHCRSFPQRTLRRIDLLILVESL
jgi:hypothetical protein